MKRNQPSYTTHRSSTHRRATSRIFPYSRTPTSVSSNVAIRRRGRTYVIDKKNPRNKARQGGAKMKPYMKGK